MTEQRPKQITLDVLYDHAVKTNVALVEINEKLAEHDTRFDEIDEKLDLILGWIGQQQ